MMTWCRVAVSKQTIKTKNNGTHGYYKCISMIYDIMCKAMGRRKFPNNIRCRNVAANKQTNKQALKIAPVETIYIIIYFNVVDMKYFYFSHCSFFPRTLRMCLPLVDLWVYKCSLGCIDAIANGLLVVVFVPLNALTSCDFIQMIACVEAIIDERFFIIGTKIRSYNLSNHEMFSWFDYYLIWITNDENKNTCLVFLMVESITSFSFYSLKLSALDSNAYQSPKKHVPQISSRC